MISARHGWGRQTGKVETERLVVADPIVERSVVKSCFKCHLISQTLRMARSMKLRCGLADTMNCG